MSTRKPAKKLGVEALLNKTEPISIQEITLQDWYASFALLYMPGSDDAALTAKGAWDIAEAMIEERNRRL